MGENKKIIKKIACIQLESRFPDFCSKIIMPRYGLPLIGNILRESGYEVKVFIEHIEKLDMEWIYQADLIVMSSMTGAANRTYEFADWVKNELKIPVILGGEHASSFADDALDWADFVVRREGDEIISDLIRTIEEGTSLDTIPGISYNKGNSKIHNEPGPPPQQINTLQDLNIIHGYPKEDGLSLMLKRRKVKVICVQSTRGCPYECKFCVTPRLFGYSYRYRDVEAVINDIKMKLPYGRDLIFTDNLFAINKKRTNYLLDRMIEEGIGKHETFTCFCRVEIGKDPDLLEKMYQAGMRTICLGLESINDVTLKNINKNQTISDVIKTIKTIQDADIDVSGSFIAGSEEDRASTLMDTTNFAIENGLVSFYFISLWYYPGDPNSPLIPQRLIMPSFDYCTGHFVTHFPKKMKPSTLQRTIINAQKRFWNLKRCVRFAVSGDFKKALHIAGHVYAFSEVERNQLEYANYLESIEYGYYDTNERLLMDRIVKREPDSIVLRSHKAAIPKFDSKESIKSGSDYNVLESSGNHF